MSNPTTSETLKHIAAALPASEHGDPIDANRVMIARAAIMAMREPPEAAIRVLVGYDFTGPDEYAAAREAWQKSIDAILFEGDRA